MANTKSVTEQIGVRLVKQIVVEFWHCRYQDISSTNDDALDGIIFISKNGEVTGEMLFVQIKTGKSYCTETDKRPNILNINLGVGHINTHRPRWNKYPGPVILIYVDDSTDKLTPKAWWCDLKSDNSYTYEAKSYALINKSRRFGEHTKGLLKKMCTHHLESQYKLVQTTNRDFTYLRINDTKHSAREYYQTLMLKPTLERSHTLLGEILINRVGWRHLCKKSRSQQRILQSFQLLGALLPIINAVDGYQILGLRKSNEDRGDLADLTILDYIGLVAKVTFEHRYQSIVRVVLKRKRIINKTSGKCTESKIWFYTIYETNRGHVAF